MIDDNTGQKEHMDKNLVDERAVYSIAEQFLTEGTWLTRKDNGLVLTKPLAGFGSTEVFPDVQIARKRIVPALIKHYQSQGKAA